MLSALVLACRTGRTHPKQQAVVDYSDALIAELKRGNAIVLGLPMYNFGVPSTPKAYFDHIARAGVTFRYPWPPPKVRGTLEHFVRSVNRIC